MNERGWLGTDQPCSWWDRIAQTAIDIVLLEAYCPDAVSRYGGDRGG
jgi:hypothetical protein